MQRPLISPIQNATSSGTDGTAVLWSRLGGLFGEYGAATSELKTRVSEEVSDDFKRLARELGMSTSGLLNVMVHTRLYGADVVASMAAKQVARVAGPGPKEAQQ